MEDKFYGRPFVITEARSNNAFNFGRRRDEKSGPPHLLVAGLIKLEFADLIKQDFRQVEPGAKVVFEDYNGDGTLVSCKGLEHFISSVLPGGAPLYIFDNHNHAFYFWHKALIEGKIRAGAKLFHVDQHKDTRKPDSSLPAAEIRNEAAVFEYTNTVLNVGNFIPAAQEDGLIGEVIFIDSEESLNNCHRLAKEAREAGSAGGSDGVGSPGMWAGINGSLQREESGSEPQSPSSGIILDIDLDFFAPEMDYIDNNKKLASIRELLPLANLVTIATSPFFIEQESAINWLKKILGIWQNPDENNLKNQ